MAIGKHCIILVCSITIIACFPQISISSVDDLRVTPVVKAVEKTKTAVVNISTYEQVYERVNPFSRFGSDPFFDRYFRDFYHDYRRKSVKTNLGSGVIIDERGYVLTNWHVVEKASSITVTTLDEKEYAAALLGADPKSDLAVLVIESDKKFTSIPMGNSEELLIGETVIAIGNPFGLTHTVTTGVVSALNRSIKADEQVYEDFIQTDASINPGNSGGPLLNIRGKLIGINTAIYGQAEGIGFAIPVNTAKRIVADLLEFGEVHPPWLGITVQNISGKVADYLGYPYNYGVIIAEIFPDSPAEKIGLKNADIIMSMASKKIKSKTAFKRILGLYTANDSISLKYFRNGVIKTVSVKATEFPPRYADELLWEGFGIKVIDNSQQIARKYGLYTSAGIVISEIKRNSQANSRGLEPGDIILKVQIVEITDTDSFKKYIIKNIHRDSLVLLVQRGRYGYYVNFEL